VIKSLGQVFKIGYTGCGKK